MLEDFDTPVPSSEAQWQTLFRNWERSYDKWLETDIDKTEASACRHVATGAARTTLKWCKANPESGWEINQKLWRSARLVHELYQAVTPGTSEPPRLKSKHTLWQHIDLRTFLQSANTEEKDAPTDHSAIKSLANAYIASVWMQNSYLDWVFVDSLMVGQLIGAFQVIMKFKYGIGYTMFGKRWKAILFRVFSVPMTFLLGWVAPGAFCWWLYRMSPTAAIVIAAAYYVVSIAMMLRYFARLILYRLRVGRTPRREMIDRVAASEVAYAELREETIHVPSLRRAVELARESGVLWEPQIFSIIDNVTAQTPTTWIRRPAI
jgi:hypothetical protein